MSPWCDRRDAFFDEELSAEEAEAFRSHLAGCADCERALRDRVLFEAMIEERRPGVAARGPSRVAGPAKARVRTILPALGALALAAGALGLLLRSKGPSPALPPAPLFASLETEPVRRLEVRFTYPGADTHRPYSPKRGGATAHEVVPIATIAKLDAEKEYRGVAAALALSGETRSAADNLARAKESPDVVSDRAAIALEEGHAEEAIALVETVLSKQPMHPQALWNQALAMTALHLPLVAADTWEKVAALGEKGWSEEARSRAEALRMSYSAHRKEWDDQVAAGRALVLAGVVPANETVALHPSFYRNSFYIASAATSSMGRIDALRPLARVLDGEPSKGPLVRYLDSLTPAVLGRRAPYVERLVAIYNNALEHEEANKLTRELANTGQKDLFFVTVDLKRTLRENADALEKIAAERGDPWMALVAKRARAQVFQGGGDYGGANRLLNEAVRECDLLNFGFLCTKIEAHRVGLLTAAHRVREGERAAVAAFARADTYLDPTNNPLRTSLATMAAQQGAYALARAYAFDAMLREPKFICGRTDAYELSAAGYLDSLDFASAKRELEQGPPCNEFFVRGMADPFYRPDELVVLARAGITLPETSQLLPAIEGARPQWSKGEALHADALKGVLLMDTDPQAGTALLAQTFNGARELPYDSEAEAALGWSALELGWQAAARGDGAAVTELFARLAGLSDSRCTLTLGVDHERFFSVARDGSGAFQVTTNRRATSYPPPLADMVPETTRSALKACGEVRVLASSRAFGLPGLLPPETAWSYRVLGNHNASGEELPAKRLVVSSVDLPPELELRPLSSAPARAESDRPTTWLHGSSATIANVLRELPTATEVEIHTHGLTDVGESDAPVLVLSPDARGDWALRSKDVATLTLKGHPIVVLAACDAAHPKTELHEHWSLPAAFTRAGARVVFAASRAIPDEAAGEFFASVLRRVRAGVNPAAALRDERVAWRTKTDGEWVDSLLLFE